MSKKKYSRTNCRLCSSGDLRLVLQLESTPVGDAYIPAEKLNNKQELHPIKLYLCNSCGLLQIIDVVDPELVYMDYIYHSSDSLGLVKHFEKYAESVINKINLPEKSLVVEIGSNDGSLLKFFKERGLQVLGIDPAKKIAQIANKSGVNTLASFFDSKLAEKIVKEYGQASIVIANNVLANIDDLQDVIKGIRHLLKPDGVVVFETGYVSSLIENTIFDNIYHEHITYFSVKDLKNFFANNEMELIDIKLVPTKGGSLRGFVQLANGPRKVSDSVTKMIDKEEALGIQKADTFALFSERLTKLKRELLSLLTNLKKKGKTIAGYGASVGVTTILYYFGLDSKIVDFLVDDNQSRHNLYSPGLHIPVLNPQNLYDKKPDYVIIFAWQYAEPIINKHKAYLEQGGHFIKFLPKIEVI